MSREGRPSTAPGTQPPVERSVRSLSPDTRYEVLMNRRRRDTLEYLLANDGTGTLSDLAEHIAAAENGIEVAQLSSDQRKRVYIGLYQCHLPKMDAAGVVDFDKNRGTVDLREEAEQLVPFLDGTPHRSTGAPRSRVTRSTAVSAGIGIGVGWIGLLLTAPVLGFSAVVFAAMALGAALVVAVAAIRGSGR